jgi:hypothetical protein
MEHTPINTITIMPDQIDVQQQRKEGVNTVLTYNRKIIAGDMQRKCNPIVIINMFNLLPPPHFRSLSFILSKLDSMASSFLMSNTTSHASCTPPCNESHKVFSNSYEQKK